MPLRRVQRNADAGPSTALYDLGVDDVTAFVLAGGKSTRMGRDKAFLPWQGGTLLSRVLDIAQSVAGEVCIVGQREKFGSFGSVVEDIYPHHGPLGGIHAGLTRSTTELNLVLAVDLPFVGTKFLEYLIVQAGQSDAMVYVPRSGGRWHPLCAIYRRDFAEVAEKALQAGKNKIDLLFTQVKTQTIEEDELERLGFSVQIFSNLNTPGDVEQSGVTGV